MMRMDFRTGWAWMWVGLVATVSTGCAESGGYVEYTSIPGPEAAAASDSEPAPDDTDHGAPAGVDAPSSQAEQPSDDSGNSRTGTSSTQEQTPVVPVSSTGDQEQGDSLSPGQVLPAAMPTGEHEIKLLVPQKRFRQERDTDAIRVSYDDIDLMKVLNMHPVPVDATDYFPDWLSALDGKRIRIFGFMYPDYKATGLTRFVLTRDTGVCCFGPDPLIYFLIDVSLRDGETTDYFESRRIDVEGTFRIDLEADDTEVYRLYRIDNAVVRSH